MNYNFFTMIRLTNTERCLIHIVRAEKHWGFEKDYNKA